MNKELTDFFVLENCENPNPQVPKPLEKIRYILDENILYLESNISREFLFNQLSGSSRPHFGTVQVAYVNDNIATAAHKILFPDSSYNTRYRVLEQNINLTFLREVFISGIASRMPLGAKLANLLSITTLIIPEKEKQDIRRRGKIFASLYAIDDKGEEIVAYWNGRYFVRKGIN